MTSSINRAEGSEKNKEDSWGDVKREFKSQALKRNELEEMDLEYGERR